MKKYSGVVYVPKYRDAAQTVRVRRAYEAVPEDIREDIVLASQWAKDTLMRHEGDGHCIYVSGQKDMVVCSFSKPEWAGDHCSKPMEHGAQAIVLAVCEYLEGV